MRRRDHWSLLLVSAGVITMLVVIIGVILTADAQ